MSGCSEFVSYYVEITSISSSGRYSSELLDKVKEMAEGVVVEDAPVFKTRDEIMKKQQVCLFYITTYNVRNEEDSLGLSAVSRSGI